MLHVNKSCELFFFWGFQKKKKNNSFFWGHHRIGNLSHWWGNSFPSWRSFGLRLAPMFPKAIIVGVNLVVFCSPWWAVGNVFLQGWAVEWSVCMQGSCSDGQRHSALCWRWGKHHPLLFICIRTKVWKTKPQKKQPDIYKQVCVCVAAAVCNCCTLSLSVSGACECTDFTTGMTCEHCLDGYYGNPLIGTPGDCQPCPCPDRTSCAQIAETGQVVCTNCPVGQQGETNHWQLKSFFFFLSLSGTSQSIMSLESRDAEATRVFWSSLRLQWTVILQCNLTFRRFQR